MAITSPAPNATVGGAITVSGTSSDNAAVVKVEVALDGGAYQLASGTSTWSWNWNTTATANGSHTVTARASDGSGNVRTISQPVSVTNAVADTVLPTLSISSPAAGSTVSGTISITGTASDNAAVAKVEVAIDGGQYSLASGTTNWAWAWSTAGASNGGHTITVRATDTSWNASTTTRSVTVSNSTADATAPTVAILTPANGATVTDNVSVGGTASDNVGVVKLELSVDGGAYQKASGLNSWTWIWNTIGLSDGSHTVTARATDGAGNTRTSSVTVTVSNPGTSWISPEGVRINVNSAGPWTVPQVYDLLKQSAVGLDKLAPVLTIKVQDGTMSATSGAASQTDGVYVRYSATIYLKGVNSNFSVNPNAVMAHEYGHAWSNYHLYLSRQGDWSSYLQTRGIAYDPRLDSAYHWDPREIIADDYRLLFGSSLAISQMPNHLNPEIPDPRTVPGLRDFLLTRWPVA